MGMFSQFLTYNQTETNAKTCRFKTLLHLLYSFVSEVTSSSLLDSMDRAEKTFFLSLKCTSFFLNTIFYFHWMCLFMCFLYCFLCVVSTFFFFLFIKLYLH